MSFFIFTIESQFLRRKKLWGIAYGTVTYAKYPVAREKLKREEKWTYFIKSCSYWNFPVSPVVKSPCSSEGDMGSIPGQRRFCMPCGAAPPAPPTHTHTHTSKSQFFILKLIFMKSFRKPLCSSPTSFLLRGLHLALHL